MLSCAPVAREALSPVCRPWRAVGECHHNTNMRIIARCTDLRGFRVNIPTEQVRAHHNIHLGMSSFSRRPQGVICWRLASGPGDAIVQNASLLLPASVEKFSGGLTNVSR